MIEVDGEVHNRGEQPARDNMRGRFLSENRYRVMRIPAVEILRDADGVADAIAALVASPLHHSAALNGPPPRTGEDQT